MAIGDHHLAVAGMIDVERLHEVGRVRHDRLVHAVEAHLHGAGLHSRAIEHVLQANPGPAALPMAPLDHCAPGTRGWK